MRQGCCVLPTDDHGRVCDRLAGLEQVIDSETIRQVLQETGRVNRRACKLTHEVVLWVVLAMGIFTNVPITNLLDEQLHPAAELIPLYHQRWEEEIVFDEQKTHQDPRRASKPANLRSETPAGVIQELYALSLAHFVVRAMMFEAAMSRELDPDRLSFTGCFQILQCRLPECHRASPSSLSLWYEALLCEMSRERAEPRRNRINPRVIKQKMSKWKKKRAEHFHPPPIQKTFAESVVMTN